MSSGKKGQQQERPTLHVRVWFQGQLVASGEVAGGLSAMKGAK